MAIERIVPETEEWEAYYANHISRYAFAKSSITSLEPLKILDAACGVGYGSHYLSSNSIWDIKAIDRSKEALKIAEKNFKGQNISFMEDDCHTLAKVSTFAPFDVIVSFETLEHLPKPASFIKNCFTNLKSGGRLIISTPNQIVSSPNELSWEFHEKEYTPIELHELLAEEGFSNIIIYGQKVTDVGRLRSQFRGELNKLNSNPFVRLGRIFQKVFRGRKFNAILPEQLEDFEIVLYENLDEIVVEGEKGPFVLIAVCEKK
jgi:SAM-dependent methyltransferase